LAVRSALPTG